MNTQPRAFTIRSSAGRIGVIVCPLCAGLVLGAGESQHAGFHLALTRPADSGGKGEPPAEPIE